MTKILSEEELQNISIRRISKPLGVNWEVVEDIIASHRLLLSANAELSFKKEIFKRAVEDIIVAVDFTDAETVRALAFKALEEAK